MALQLKYLDLFTRLQKVKADMFASAHNSSPGQVEVPDELWHRIVDTMSELEEEMYPQENVKQKDDDGANEGSGRATS